MRKALPWILLAGVAALVLWYWKGRGTVAAAADQPEVTVSGGGQAWNLEEPGQYVFEWDWETGTWKQRSYTPPDTTPEYEPPGGGGGVNMPGDWPWEYQTEYQDPGYSTPQYTPPEEPLVTQPTGEEHYSYNPATGQWEVSYGEAKAAAPEYPTETQVPLPAPVIIGTPELPLTTVIPEPLIPLTGAGGWYERRDIENVLGWTEGQFEAEVALARVTPSDERTLEQTYAGGYADSLEQAFAQTNFKQSVAALGGAYVGGVLQPPSDWAGSVTEFAAYAREMIDYRYM